MGRVAGLAAVACVAPLKGCATRRDTRQPVTTATTCDAFATCDGPDDTPGVGLVSTGLGAQTARGLRLRRHQF